MIVRRRRAAFTAALAAGVVGGALVVAAPAADAGSARSGPALLRELSHHGSGQARPGAVPSAAQLVTAPVRDSAIVYVVDTGAGEGIRLRHLATGVTEDVIAPAANVSFTDPVVSPDGSQVAYAEATSLSNPFNVYVASLSGTPNPRRVAMSTQNQIAPDWAPNGNTLLYSQLDLTGTSPSSSLRTVDVSTSPFGAPTTIVADGVEGRYAVCEPSPGVTCLVPNPSKIAYVIASTGELATANADGTSVTSLGVDGEYPSWSPGTDQLVYQYAKGSPGSFGLATIGLNADGTASGPENQIDATTSTTITAEHPSYSHDGSEIYFSRAGFATGGPTTDYNLASVALQEERFVADLTYQSTADEFDGHRVDGDIGHGTTSTFTAITPRRILDTRPGYLRIGTCNQLAAGGTCEFTVAPLAPDVPAGVNAVVLNITGISPSAATDLRVYPKAGVITPVPVVSNLNLAAGQTAAVAAVVKAGGSVNGPNKVIIRNAAGTVNVAIDIAGYFRADMNHDRFHALTPKRLADSRTGLGCRPLGPGGICTLTMTQDGTAALPPEATAVVFNLTGLAGSSAADVRAYPGDVTTVPLVSNLNLAARAVRANLVTVALPAGSNNTIKIRNSAGTTNVVVDIAGFYTSDAADPAGSFFHPIDPVRILDTRYGQKTPDGNPLRLTAGGIEQVVTHDTVTTAFGGTELATRSTSLVANLTAVGPTASTYLVAYPADLASPPLASNINAPAGANVPNLLFVTTAGTPGIARGDIKVRNANGEVSLVLDVAGFFEDN